MNILFMCVANSARSQLAESIARFVLSGKHRIYSAGSQPSQVNPNVIPTLNEVQIPCEGLYSKSVDQLPSDFINQLDYIITLCQEEVCPIVETRALKLHWPMKDPVDSNATNNELLKNFSNTRDILLERLKKFKLEINNS